MSVFKYLKIILVLVTTLPLIAKSHEEKITRSGMIKISIVDSLLQEAKKNKGIIEEHQKKIEVELKKFKSDNALLFEMAGDPPRLDIVPFQFPLFFLVHELANGPSIYGTNVFDAIAESSDSRKIDTLLEIIREKKFGASPIKY